MRVRARIPALVAAAAGGVAAAGVVAAAATAAGAAAVSCYDIVRRLYVARGT